MVHRDEQENRAAAAGISARFQLSADLKFLRSTPSRAKPPNIDRSVDHADLVRLEPVSFHQLLGDHLAVDHKMAGLARGVQFSLECQLGPVLRADAFQRMQHVIREKPVATSTCPMQIMRNRSAEPNRHIDLQTRDCGLSRFGELAQ